MGKRSSEQGKDAISQRLSDVAVVAMHGVHHELQGRIKNCAGFFRIESFDKCRRAFKVREKGGDSFPFTVGSTTGFQRCLFSANTFGEMGRRVANGSRV